MGGGKLKAAVIDAVKAFERGDLSLQDAERYIIALYDVSSLFVTRDIAELAIERLRRHARV